MATLEERGYGSAVDTETARAAAAAAKQVVVQSEIDLKNTKVVAPAGSVVLTRHREPGEFTNVGEELFELGPIENVLHGGGGADGQDGICDAGDEAEVSIDSFPGRSLFKGEVVKVDAGGERGDADIRGVHPDRDKDLRLKPG